MIYERLAGFVQHRMMMSYVYWPMMLVTLLRRDGTPIEAARATLEQEGSRGDAL
jgi:hypothetical protein